jgi:tetratricopeptide (TPR) repeat protein
MRTLKYFRLVITALSLIACVVSASAQGAKPVAGNAEDKAKAEAFEKERARIEELNKKIAAANEVLSRTFKAGNEALNAGRYDEAIAAYSEGIAAREEAALYANRSEALRRRGIERYNAAIQNKDTAAKQSGLDAAFKDWRDAAESARKALALVNAQPAATDPAAADMQGRNKLAALSTYAEAMRFVASKVDRTQVDAATTAYGEYIAATVDPAKKAKLQKDLAKMMFDAGAYDKAIGEYRKMLTADPNDAIAQLYLGFSLFSTGDTANFQEAANYLRAFIEMSPETDPLKAEASAILDFLKSNENITPKGIR